MIYQVSIEVSPQQAMLDLKGDIQFLKSWAAMGNLEFPTLPNSAITCADTSIYWIGREHWLVRAPLDAEERLYSISEAAGMIDEISAIVISDVLSFYSVQGADSDQLISIASPLDVHKSVFPANGVTYTEFFGIKALVVRTDGGFEVGVDRSYFDMMGDCFGRVMGSDH